MTRAFLAAAAALTLFTRSALGGDSVSSSPAHVSDTTPPGFTKKVCACTSEELVDVTTMPWEAAPSSEEVAEGDCPRANYRNQGGNWFPDGVTEGCATASSDPTSPDYCFKYKEVDARTGMAYPCEIPSELRGLSGEYAGYNVAFGHPAEGYNGNIGRSCGGCRRKPSYASNGNAACKSDECTNVIISNMNGVMHGYDGLHADAQYRVTSANQYTGHVSTFYKYGKLENA